MKYMLSGGFESKPLMRLSLGLTFAFMVLFVVSSFALYFSRMSLDPASVVDYYLGSEETFRPARTFGSMLEVAHAHLAMMAVVLLMLTHLFIFAPFSLRTKAWTISLAFVCALFDEGGGWLVRFVHPSFAVLKVAGFVGLQATLLFLLGSLGMFILRGGRPAGRFHPVLLGNDTIEDVEEEEERHP